MRIYKELVQLHPTHPFKRSLHQSRSFFSTLNDFAVSSVTVSCITSWTYQVKNKIYYFLSVFRKARVLPTFNN